MRVAYGGQEAMTFMDYIDAATGRTLHAEPGGVYDITPAGRPVDEYPAHWFTAVDPEELARLQAEREAEAARLAAESAAAEGGGEPSGDPPESVQPEG